MIVSSLTCSNRGSTPSPCSPSFRSWRLKTSRASSGPRQLGVRFHHRWPCGTPRHSASSAKSEANRRGSPSFSASAAARSASITAPVSHRASATIGDVAEPRLTLYQAEWCPFSAAVREVLTELDLDVVLRQVEPEPEQRDAMRAATGTDSIPVLVSEDGRVHRGTREIFAHLRERDPGRFAAGHRRQHAGHREARETDATGKLIERFRGTAELEAVEHDAPV